MSDRILKPTSFHTMTPPPTTARPPTKSSSSFLSRLCTAISDCMMPIPVSKPVKVRLINSWQDVTSERIATIVHNFLYDESSRWNELEQVTGFRREHIFFTVSALLAFLLLHGHFMSTVVVLASIVIPTLCTLQAVNATNREDQVYWQRYWVLFGVFSAAEYCYGRVCPDSSLDHIKLGLLAVAFVPFYPASTYLFDLINMPYIAIRDKFEKYNYQLVQ